MSTFREERKITPPDHQACLNITQLIQETISKSGVKEGYVLVQTKHTTTGLISGKKTKRAIALLIQEDERGFKHDLLEILEGLVSQKQYWEHDDFDKRTENIGPEERKNGAAHSKASFLPSSITCDIHEGRLSLGTWQSILFFDFDPEGRMERRIVIRVMGE